MIYTLKIALTTTIGESRETNRFEYDYAVNFLKEIDRDASYYDRELKIYIENTQALSFIYQVEIQNICLRLSQRLQKASEFIRRTNYAFNRMELKVKANNGQVVSIENKDELTKTWQKLRALLAKEYEGEPAHQYLKEIDEKLVVNEAAYCYQNFGLLFPRIPQEHHKDEWENKRRIKLSPYEDDLFEEHVTYVETVDGIRKYKIEGVAFPDSKLIVDKFEGYCDVPVDQLFPVKTVIEVMYKNDDVINQWNFTIQKITK